MLFLVLEVMLTFYLRSKFLLILLLGFISGLPLALTGSTLTTMLKDFDVDITLIGLFGLVGIPYSFKYLWSPIIDNINIPLFSRFGRRKGWLVFIQLVLAFNVFAISIFNPQEHILIIGLLACSLSFVSATQDIVIDALRIEILEKNEQGAGSSSAVLGYRFGMIASTAGALYLAHFLSWKIAYSSMAVIVIFAMILCAVFIKEKQLELNQNREKNILKWIESAYLNPLREFVTKPRWGYIIGFIMFYKLSDAFIGSLTSPFLLEVGFSKIDIANIVKLYGMIATIVGGLLGGYVLEKISITKGLVLGLIVQMLSNLAFILLLYTGASDSALAVVISIENFCSGIGTAALVAYISNLCNIRYTATQYALLSSIATLGRAVFSGASGYVVKSLGWENFFIFSAVISLPAFILLWLCVRTFKLKANPKLVYSTNFD